MDQAEQQQQAHWREAQRLGQREGDQREQRQFQRAGVGEILWLPFLDPREIRQLGQLQRKQQPLDPERRDQRRHQARNPEQRPIREDGNAPPYRRQKERFQRERANQREAEREAAVQIGPQ